MQDIIKKSKFAMHQEERDAMMAKRYYELVSAGMAKMVIWDTIMDEFGVFTIDAVKRAIRRHADRLQQREDTR